MTMLARDLEREIETAKAICASLIDILGDDVEARGDLVEGQTSVKELVGVAVTRIAEIDEMMAGIDAMMARLKSRKSRLESQAEYLRTLTASAMDMAGWSKLEFPMGTISVRNVPPAVRVIDEAQIPSTYWKRPPPKLDKRALLSDLKKEGASIPGAELSNGGTTVAIKLT